MLANRFTLQSRLIFAVLLPCIALLFVGSSGLKSMLDIRNQAEYLYLNTSSPMHSMGNVTSRIPRMRVGIDMMLLQETSLRDSKGIITRAREAREEDIPEMRQSIQNAVDSQVNVKRRKEIEELQIEFEKVVKNELNPMLTAFENNDIVTAKQIYHDRYAKNYGEMRKKAQSIMNSMLEQAREQNEVSQESYSSGQFDMFAIIGFSLIISSIFSYFIVISLKRRVSYLQTTIATAANDMALNVRIELSGKDEITAIGNSFNLFIDKVHTSIEEVAASSRELTDTARKISDDAKITQSNCTSQRDRTVQVATAIHELGATVHEIAGNAAKASEVAIQATHQAKVGGDNVGTAREQIIDLTDELEQATDVVGSLANQIGDISSILETIRSISDQTNLLALNAAIEAARAGEQGRGFAVVADEVRSLASRSAGSTDEIQNLIERLKSESSRAVDAMSKGKEKSLLVVEQADNTNDSLLQIGNHIGLISDQNIQVATATEEQSSVVTEINRNVEDINQLTIETADVAEQLANSSEHLHGLSNQLDKLVNSFKL
ncbi:methyl-accepting chemotaxis protein [Photobacterium frigidiphilum]|uniref:methyl-accepting chemotaxis protein n=1 Tax=Photobacterium frigidiphilum TaxID=264736 RepID=UPI003D13144F